MSLFDTTDAVGSTLEDGEYVGTIVGSEVKETKAGNGRYLVLQWKLESGFNVWSNYNIDNPNPVAVNIAKGQLADIQLANGLPKGPVNSTEEMLGLKCLLRVENKTDSYGTKLEIKKHSAAPAKSDDDIDF